MDAVEFYKSMKRMCYSGEMCEKCPLYNNFSEMGSVCDVLLHITDEKASKVKSIVEQWAKGHPVKTRKSEFQKMFPNANMYSITTTFCTAHFDKKKACEVGVASEEMCEKCRYKYWNEEIDE